METSNGYKFTVKNGIAHLSIPRTKGIFSPEVQEAKLELIDLESKGSVSFKEIKVKKV